MGTGIYKETLSYCAETCPDVDSEFDDFIKKVSDYIAPANHHEVTEMVWELCNKVKSVGTEKLRDALRSCVSDKRDLESEVNDLNDQISHLEHQLDMLS